MQTCGEQTYRCADAGRPTGVRRRPNASIPRAHLCVVGLVVILSVGGSGAALANTSVWSPVPDHSTVGFNPCTEEEVGLQLHDVSMLVSGRGDHEGLKFRGAFTTADGYSGVFRDQDQWNAVPRPGHGHLTAVLLFRGGDGAKQRIVFTAVVRLVVRDGVAVERLLVGDARCVGQPVRVD